MELMRLRTNSRKRYSTSCAALACYLQCCDDGWIVNVEPGDDYSILAVNNENLWMGE